MGIFYQFWGILSRALESRVKAYLKTQFDTDPGSIQGTILYQKNRSLWILLKAL
jgi:hypothetical protein